MVFLSKLSSLSMSLTWVKVKKSWTFKIPILKLEVCRLTTQISSLNGQLSLDRLTIYRRTYYNPPNSAFWGWLSVESQPQNPEIRNNHMLSMLHQCRHWSQSDQCLHWSSMSWCNIWSAASRMTAVNLSETASHSVIKVTFRQVTSTSSIKDANAFGVP